MRYGTALRGDLPWESNAFVIRFKHEYTGLNHVIFRRRRLHFRMFQLCLSPSRHCLTVFFSVCVCVSMLVMELQTSFQKLSRKSIISALPILDASSITSEGRVWQKYHGRETLRLLKIKGVMLLADGNEALRIFNGARLLWQEAGASAVPSVVCEAWTAPNLQARESECPLPTYAYAHTSCFCLWLTASVCMSLSFPAGAFGKCQWA